MASFKFIRGCFITVATFFVFCGVMSPLQSYGRLFTGIQSDLNTTTIQTGWIGSVAWAAHYLVSPLALVSENIIGYRLTLVIGAIVSSGCYLVSSYMTSFLSLLLVMGVLNGSAIGLCMHSAFCVLFKYFSASGRTRASGVAMLGSSFGAVFLSVFYEMFVPKRGWRFVLQITAIFAAVLSIPASFLVIPNKNHIRAAGENGNKDTNFAGGTNVPEQAQDDESDIAPTRSRQKTMGITKLRRFLPSKSGNTVRGDGNPSGKTGSQETSTASGPTHEEGLAHTGMQEDHTPRSRTAASVAKLRRTIPFGSSRVPVEEGENVPSNERGKNATVEGAVSTDEVINQPAQQSSLKSRVTDFGSRLRGSLPLKSSKNPIDAEEGSRTVPPEQICDNVPEDTSTEQRVESADIPGRQSSRTSRKSRFGGMTKLLPKARSGSIAKDENTKQTTIQTARDENAKQTEIQTERDNPSDSSVKVRDWSRNSKSKLEADTALKESQANNENRSASSPPVGQSVDSEPGELAADDLRNDPASPSQLSCASSFIRCCRTWLGILSDTRAWLIFFAILFPAMSWSVFWMNSISYFKSISIPRESVLVYVVVATISDLFGRASLTFLVTCLSVKESSLLLASNLIIMVVTLAFLLAPIHPVLIVCSVFIGIGRGWYDILPYKAGVDFLELADSDRGLTLVMVSLGLGFSLGTLPAGAIYDATGSYQYAFIINSILYLVGGTIQLCLQLSRNHKRRNSGKNNQRGEGDEHVEKVELEESPFDKIEDIEG